MDSGLSGTDRDESVTVAVTHLCSIEGCERKHYGKGFCQPHYRAHRSGTLYRKPKPKPTCSADGCDRPATTRGLCATHYQAQRRATGADRPQRRIFQKRKYVPAECAVTGCEKPRASKYLCADHWLQVSDHIEATKRAAEETKHLTVPQRRVFYPDVDEEPTRVYVLRIDGYEKQRYYTAPDALAYFPRWNPTARLVSIVEYPQSADRAACRIIREVLPVAKLISETAI